MFPDTQGPSVIQGTGPYLVSNIPVVLVNIAMTQRSSNATAKLVIQGKSAIVAPGKIPMSDADSQGTGTLSGGAMGACEAVIYSSALSVGGKGVVRFGDAATNNNRNSLGLKVSPGCTKLMVCR